MCCPRLRRNAVPVSMLLDILEGHGKDEKYVARHYRYLCAPPSSFRVLLLKRACIRAQAPPRARCADFKFPASAGVCSSLSITVLLLPVLPAPRKAPKLMPIVISPLGTSLLDTRDSGVKLQTPSLSSYRGKRANLCVQELLNDEKRMSLQL